MAFRFVQHRPSLLIDDHTALADEHEMRHCAGSAPGRFGKNAQADRSIFHLLPRSARQMNPVQPNSSISVRLSY